MANPTLDRYLEAEVLHADPLKLVTLLYRGARDAISCAILALEQGDVPARSRQIVKAWEIVHELSASLDHQKGGQISAQLAELYAYVGQRLLDANAEQSRKPLEDAATVLAILAEAWSSQQAQQRPAAVAC